MIYEGLRPEQADHLLRTLDSIDWSLTGMLIVACIWALAYVAVHTGASDE